MKITKFIPLSEILPKIEDPRSAHGRRHRLDVQLSGVHFTPLLQVF